MKSEILDPIKSPRVLYEERKSRLEERKEFAQSMYQQIGELFGEENLVCPYCGKKLGFFIPESVLKGHHLITDSYRDVKQNWISSFGLTSAWRRKNKRPYINFELDCHKSDRDYDYCGFRKNKEGKWEFYHGSNNLPSDNTW